MTPTAHLHLPPLPLRLAYQFGVLLRHGPIYTGSPYNPASVERIKTMKLTVKCTLEAPKAEFDPIRRNQAMLPYLIVGEERHCVGHLGDKGVNRAKMLKDIKRLCGGRPAPRGVKFGDEWEFEVDPEAVSAYGWSNGTTPMLDRFDWSPGDELHEGEFLGIELSDNVLAVVDQT